MAALTAIARLARRVVRRRPRLAKRAEFLMDARGEYKTLKERKEKRR